MKLKLILLLFILSGCFEEAKDCTMPLGTRVKVKYINKEGTIVRKLARNYYQVQYDNGIYEAGGLRCDRLTIINKPLK